VTEQAIASDPRVGRDVGLAPAPRPRPGPPGWAVLGSVFLSGAVLLGVELAASRVLAPAFGNSLFVWGSIIGVILAGLAVGYWLGGIVGDLRPRAGSLLVALAAGAAAVLAIPLVDDRVVAGVLEWDPGPRLDPLLCALALFGPASVLLSAVGPIAVRLQAGAVDTAGRTAGRTFAVSTAGSIAGTFATAFWLVPELGTAQLFGLGAAVLFATVAALALVARLPAPAVAALAAAAGAAAVTVSLGEPHSGPLSAASTRNWSPLYRLHGYGALDPRDRTADPVDPSLTIVHAEDTRYHRLAVVEDADTRYLRFDNSLQSAMYLDDPFRTRFRYTDLFHLGVAYNPSARRVLYVGLGAGSSEKRLWRDFPRLSLTVVELDPVVVEVARRWFALPDSPRLRVEVGDGRRFLADHRQQWDVVVVDAFFADAIPAHLVTAEFLSLLRSRLAPGGVVVTNVIGALEGPGSKLFRSVYKTYRQGFPTVLVHPAILPGDRGDASYRNLIVVATEKATPSRSALAERWEELRRHTPTAPDLRKPILDRHDAEIETADVPVLTDDYAPTDALLLLFQ
jgi:spermidine synthase